MSESIQVTASEEIAAVKAGDIDGDVYRDGQVFAEVCSLLRWRTAHPIYSADRDGIAA